MNATIASDQKLIQQILAGERDAFASLVERHLQSALAIARARLANAADADDAVQEAFLRAFERLRTLREPAKFGPWLLTIVRHEASRLIARRRTTVGADPATAPEIASVPNPSQHEIHALLREHIAHLPEPAREVLLLHYFAGHNAHEIAGLLDLRHAAVRKRLQRAREQLAKTLLHELETARPSSDSLKTQAARITALASALALPQAVSGASAATVATAGAGLKWAAGVAVVVGLMAILALASRTGDRQSESVDNVNRSMASAAALQTVEPASTIAGETHATPVMDNPAATPPNAAEATAAWGESDSTTPHPENLTGSWYFYMAHLAPSATMDNTHFELHNKHFRFEDNGITLRMFHDEGGVIATKGEGKIAGNRLFMDFTETHAGSQKIAHLEGPYEPDSNQMSLTGWVRWDTLPQEGIPDGYRGEQWAVTLVWTRRSDSEVAESDYVQARVDEMGALYRALVAYANDHLHRMPQRLQDLVPRYLPGLSQFAPEAGVTSFTYTPLEYLISGEEVNDLLHEAIYPVDGDPDRERQQRIDLEQLLRRFIRPDHSGVPRTIAVAAYDRYELNLTLNAFGDWRVYGSGCEDDVGDTKSPEELVQECQKRMERTALNLMSFTNAWRRGPAGWSTLLHWSLDVCSLYCPGRRDERIAHEILFPNATTEELVATYEALFGPFDPSRPIPGGSPLANVYAHIPTIIETGECSHSGGRHVAFIDGHVEFRNGRLEDHPDLAPFLNLR